MQNKDHGRCLVCDDNAIGINFGVPTCMPCKAFFRRNAVKLGIYDFVCQNDGDCIITYKYHRSCNCCRLAKCFRVGMKKSFILTVEEREARNKLVLENRLKRGQIPKFNSTKRIKLPSLLRMSSRSIQQLSSSDQVLLNNVFHAYQDTCIIARNTYLQYFPTIPHTSVHEFIDELSPIFQIFIEYLKHIPEFVRLIIDDKIRLIKNHIGTVLNINESLMYSLTSTNLILTWTNIFGSDIAELLLKRHQITQQYTFDPIILKLILIILVFSGGNSRYIQYIDLNSICNDTLSIFAAQNIYVELLWKYILSHSSNELEAVKFLNRLMMCLLYAQNIGMYIDEYIHSLKDEIKQMEPIMRSMWPRICEEDINIVQNNSFQ